MNEELARLERENPALFAEAYDCVKEKRVKKYIFNQATGLGG